MGNKWNGIIKIYNTDKILIFKCDLTYGKLCGKVKEYNQFGCMIFDGEYLDGKRNGSGKEYGENKKLIFEGEYLYGHRKKGKIFENGKPTDKEYFLPIEESEKKRI